MQTPTTVPYALEEIELGGRRYTLLASFYAIKRIKEQTGIDLRRLESLAEWDTDHLPVMLYEMLQHQEGAPTMEEIERQFDLRNAGYLGERIFAAIGVDIYALAEECEAMGEAIERGEDPLEYARRRRRNRRGRRRSSSSSGRSAASA